MPKPCRLAALALLLLGAGVSAAPAAGEGRVDLSSFRGVYRGTVAATLSGRTYRGTARIAVRVGRRGRSATMAVSGGFLAQGKSFPVSNRFTFSRSRNFTERSVTNGFSGGTIGAHGRYRAHRRLLVFRAPFIANQTSGTTDVAVAIRPGRRGKQILSLSTSIAFEGRPPDYLFHFQVSKNLEP